MFLWWTGQNSKCTLDWPARKEATLTIVKMSGLRLAGILLGFVLLAAATNEASVPQESALPSSVARNLHIF